MRKKQKLILTLGAMDPPYCRTVEKIIHDSLLVESVDSAYPIFLVRIYNVLMRRKKYPLYIEWKCILKDLMKQRIDRILPYLGVCSIKDNT